MYTYNETCKIITSFLTDRSTFMLELRKKAAKLSNLQSRVCEAREQQQNLVSSAIQRLKWAAGANPALGEVMSAFDNAVLSACDKLTRQHNLAAMVVNTCNSILHYEALRTRTSESVTHDANLVKLIKHWEESCILTANLNITVTMTEESLVQLLQLENNVDATWLKQAEKMVSEAIIDTQKKLQEKQEALFTVEDYLRERVMNLQNVLAEHHRLMSDVRALLKTMVKQENIDGLQDFLFAYRSFTENVSAVVKELEAENFDSARGMVMKEELEVMAIKVPSLYNRLLAFASEHKLNSAKGTEKPASNLPRKRKKKKKGKLVRQDSVYLSPRKGIPLARDPTTGKGRYRSLFVPSDFRRYFRDPRISNNSLSPSCSRARAKRLRAERVASRAYEARGSRSATVAQVYHGRTGGIRDT